MGAAANMLVERVVRRIFMLRGHRVMLSTDLAELYEVPTKVLVQAVKRNVSRFPDDFMFRLGPQEVASLRSQIVTSKKLGRGGERYAPLAFTEQGVAMLSSVLRSERAVQVTSRSFARSCGFAISSPAIRSWPSRSPSSRSGTTSSSASSSRRSNS
jgi:hypothetical protein